MIRTFKKESKYVIVELFGQMNKLIRMNIKLTERSLKINLKILNLFVHKQSMKELSI